MAWRRAYGEAQLAGGVLMVSVFRRGKRTSQDRGTTTFIPSEYDVCGDVHCIHHLPGIQYNTFDVMSQAMAFGRKLPAVAYRPMTTMPGQLKGRNQGPVGLDYQCTGISSA